MQKYANESGRSGIVGFEIDEHSILILFHDGWKYLYTVESAGSENIASMHNLAVSGTGLNSFVSKHVKQRYVRKFR